MPNLHISACAKTEAVDRAYTLKFTVLSWVNNICTSKQYHFMLLFHLFVWWHKSMYSRVYDIVSKFTFTTYSYVHITKMHLCVPYYYCTVQYGTTYRGLFRHFSYYYFLLLRKQHLARKFESFAGSMQSVGDRGGRISPTRKSFSFFGLKNAFSPLIFPSFSTKSRRGLLFSPMAPLKKKASGRERKRVHASMQYFMSCGRERRHQSWTLLAQTKNEGLSP